MIDSGLATATSPAPLEVRLLDGAARMDADHAQRVVARADEAVGRLRRGDHEVASGDGELLVAGSPSSWITS